MTAAVAQTTDDELCVQVSDGHKWSFIVAALTKRTLQIPGIKPADRLRLLERLNGLTDDWFTADMLAGMSQRVTPAMPSSRNKIGRRGAGQYALPGELRGIGKAKSLPPFLHAQSVRPGRDQTSRG